jgi:hypothetical protein
MGRISSGHHPARLLRPHPRLPLWAGVRSRAAVAESIGPEVGRDGLTHQGEFIGPDAGVAPGRADLCFASLSCNFPGLPELVGHPESDLTYEACFHVTLNAELPVSAEGLARVRVPDG